MNEWKKLIKAKHFSYKLWSTKVKNKTAVSKTTDVTVSGKLKMIVRSHRMIGALFRNAILYTDVFTFKRKRFHWGWQVSLKKASPDYWIPYVGREPPLRWEKSIVTILSHFCASCSGKRNSLWAETPSLSPMALPIIHPSHVYPLLHRLLSKACSLLEILAHNWDAIYTTGWFDIRLGLYSGQPCSACISVKTSSSR